MADQQTPEKAPLTRGQRAAATRAANKKKQTQQKPLPVAVLQDVLASLEEASAALQSYAGIKNASVTLVIENGKDEHEMTATHDGLDWTLERVRF